VVVWLDVFGLDSTASVKALPNCIICLMYTVFVKASFRERTSLVT
jgi:hypothetical protein